jgi:hypothetical protein
MDTSLNIVGLLLSAAMTTSTTSTGNGEWYFGPDVSENYACSKAEQLAKVDAIRNAIGESVFVQEFNQCVEIKDEVKCANSNEMYSLTDSYITRVQKSDRLVESYMGRTVCTVKVKVRVTNERPNIDAYVDGRFFYRAGENIKWTVKTNTPSKVYVFYVEGNKANMVWPTFVGTNHTVANELTLPTPGYKMTARASKNKLDKSVMFVLTNKEPNFMREYELEDLNNKLLSIPIVDRRVIRRNIMIEQ